MLRAKHLVGGLTFRQEGLTIGVETFYTTTTGLTRYFNNWRERTQTLYQGQSRVYGMDLLVKQYFKKHEIWASYTLSKTEEYFPYLPFHEYVDAPQDQRHEVKGALLLNFKPFFFSANYVYGSGSTVWFHQHSCRGGPLHSHPVSEFVILTRSTDFVGSQWLNEAHFYSL